MKEREVTQLIGVRLVHVLLALLGLGVELEFESVHRSMMAETETERESETNLCGSRHFHTTQEVAALAHSGNLYSAPCPR